MWVNSSLRYNYKIPSEPLILFIRDILTLTFGGRIYWAVMVVLVHLEVAQCVH
jgi:hypothetical protein